MKNAHNVACPDFDKSLFPKTRMSKKGTCTCRFWAVLGLFGPFWAVLGLFGPFWAVLGAFYVPILAKAFSGKQECPKKGHAAPDPSPVAPPENGKPFILETRMPQKGTCRTRSVAGCTP
jgi:hypothetical protein